jgi:Rps23 Pro-64 3,4-dihydroxylase Tpa1-like proline 4-hydroxylase
MRDNLPEPARYLLGQMATDIGCRGVPDLTLHGAGLHMMGRDDFLDCHYDADRHPQLGLKRAYNAILFLDDWNARWGGQLEIWDDGGERVLYSAYPAAGKLVVFDATLRHSVLRPLTCPEGVYRRSLALYFWEGPPIGWKPERPRALFLPALGEPKNEALDEMRKARSQLT